MIRTIIISTILFKGISFAATEELQEIKDKNIKTVDVCPDKFIDYKLITDESSFLENKKRLFFRQNSYSAKEFKLKIYGSLKTENLDGVIYYFVKSKNEKDEYLWLNTDVITLDPSLNEEQLLKRINKNICGNISE